VTAVGGCCGSLHDSCTLKKHREMKKVLILLLAVLGLVGAAVGSGSTIVSTSMLASHCNQSEIVVKFVVDNIGQVLLTLDWGSLGANTLLYDLRAVLITILVFYGVTMLMNGAALIADCSRRNFGKRYRQEPLLANVGGSGLGVQQQQQTQTY
jgi:hypothetical protein